MSLHHLNHLRWRQVWDKLRANSLCSGKISILLQCIPPTHQRQPRMGKIVLKLSPCFQQQIHPFLRAELPHEQHTLLLRRCCSGLKQIRVDTIWDDGHALRGHPPPDYFLANGIRQCAHPVKYFWCSWHMGGKGSDIAICSGCHWHTQHLYACSLRHSCQRNRIFIQFADMQHRAAT